MKCFLLHSCIFVFLLVAWKGMLSVDFYSKHDEKLARLAELSLRFLTNWTFVSISQKIRVGRFVLNHAYLVLPMSIKLELF